MLCSRLAHGPLDLGPASLGGRRPCTIEALGHALLAPPDPVSGGHGDGSAGILSESLADLHGYRPFQIRT